MGSHVDALDPPEIAPLVGLGKLNRNAPGTDVGKSQISIHEIAPEEYSEWNALVSESPDGSIYSTPEYLEALCTAGGGRFRILGVQHGDELAGGIALYERDSTFGPYVSPRLLLYYNGPVLRAYDTRYPAQQTSNRIRTLFALEAALSEAGYGGVVLRCRSTVTDIRPLLARGWTARVSYTYVIPIADLEKAWSRVEQNLRRLVKRCTREQIAFTEDADFDSFFELHARTMERRDIATYVARDRFAHYFETLARQGLCRLYHARLPDGRAIASQLVLLGAHPVTHTVSAAADPEHMNLGASAFLRWKVFEALSALGHTANDLTDAALNPVTRFKSQLGGDLEPCFVLQSPGTRVYRLGTGATELYRRLRGAAGARVRRVRSLLRL